MDKFLFGVQSAVLLIVRLAFGAGMAYHGLTRVFHGYSYYEALLESVGLPLPVVFFWGAVVLEIGGGAMIAIGVLTRVVAAAFVAEFTVKILWLHWQHGFWVGDNGYEYPAALALIALLLVGCGAGVVAVDRLIFGRKKKDDDSVISY
jgi:putative oxidoreductase